jgi:hypothetical protein
LRDARPEQIAVEGNLPPQLRKGGGKEIQDSSGKRSLDPAMKHVKFLIELFRRKKAIGGKKFLRRLTGDDGALVEALRRERARGVNEVVTGWG